MAKEKEAKAVETRAVDTAKEREEFVKRKMKAINQMTSPAKARRAATRLLRK